MLYHLFDWLTQHWTTSRFPGSGLFQFITFRVLLAVLLSLIITTVYGRKLINNKITDRAVKMLMNKSGIADYASAKEILLQQGSVKKALVHLSQTS